MRARVAFAAAMILAGASVAACAGILGFDRLEAAQGPDATTPEAGTPDAPLEAACVEIPDDGGACSQSGLPGPPATGDATELPAMLFAFSIFDLGIPQTGGLPALASGINLDRTCTTSAATSSCTPPANADLTKLVDRDGGIDNNGQELMQFLASGSDFSPQGINDLLLDGKFGAVVNLDRYNGTDNDTKVTVSLVPAIGMRGGGKPSFDELDKWNPDGEFYTGNDQSVFLTQDAYVRDGLLVASFDHVVFRLPVAPNSPFLNFDIDDVTLFAKIESSTNDAGDKRFRLVEGQVVGRWAAKKLLGTIGALTAPGIADNGICNAKILIGTLRSKVCPARDLAVRAKDDVPLDKRACATRPACAAVSAAARFDAYFVRGTGDTVFLDGGLGDAGRAPDGGDRCPAGYDDCDRDF